MPPQLRYQESGQRHLHLRPTPIPQKDATYHHAPHHLSRKLKLRPSPYPGRIKPRPLPGHVFLKKNRKTNRMPEWLRKSSYEVTIKRANSRYPLRTGRIDVSWGSAEQLPHLVLSGSKKSHMIWGKRLRKRTSQALIASTMSSALRHPCILAFTATITSFPS